MPHTKTSGSDAIWITTRLAIYIRDSWLCFVCRKEVGHERHRPELPRASLDHIDPGNNHRPTNLITMCTSCNNTKRSKHLKAWRPDLYPPAKRQARRKLDRVTARVMAISLGYHKRLTRQRARKP